MFKKQKASLVMIDYIFKELNYKYNPEKEINGYDLDMNFSSVQETYKELLLLKEEGCLECLLNGEIPSLLFSIKYVNTLKLYKYKRKYYGKQQQSIIHLKTLERISRIIGDIEGGSLLSEKLKNYEEIPSYLIIYPETKWRLFYNLFEILSTSIYTTSHKLLFKIIEDFLDLRNFCSLEEGLQIQKEISEALILDGYKFSRGKIAQTNDQNHIYDLYLENKEGKLIKPNVNRNIQDYIDSGKYKEISLKINQNTGKIDMMHGFIDYSADEINQAQISKRHPYSETNVKTHGSKAKKYEVKEKIKVDNEI